MTNEELIKKAASEIHHEQGIVDNEDKKDKKSNKSIEEAINKAMKDEKEVIFLEE